MWSIYRGLPPDKVDSHTTDSLDNLTTQRAIRLQSNVAGLPAVLWLGLVFGGVVTTAFALVLHMNNIQLHAALTALLAGLIATCIWMIVMINHPFAGEVQVSTAAFQHAIYVIDNLPR